MSLEPSVQGIFPRTLSAGFANSCGRLLKSQSHFRADVNALTWKPRAWPPRAGRSGAPEGHEPVCVRMWPLSLREFCNKIGVAGGESYGSYRVERTSHLWSCFYPGPLAASRWARKSNPSSTPSARTARRIS
jgi:hypothetical protein